MHRSLGALRDAGAKVVAIEASSIGLDQGRLDHVAIELAGFTNLTHDHLDYHRTFQAYRDAKLSLFGWPGLRAAVVNADAEVGRGLPKTRPEERRVGTAGGRRGRYRGK